ncbi:hypothetical protein F5887DRAFT_991270 [Amanita rubescens]|nr:hypothetical protein F5887DRAFT_991270 [Amanita rubescens]
MATDIIFIDRLGLSANIGLDTWGRRRPQPTFISVYLHLTPDGFLSRAGQSDNVKHTIDYGSLTKAVTRYVEQKEENGFQSAEQVIDGVMNKAFELAGGNGKEVRVVLELPKLVPLAEGGIAVEMTRKATPQAGAAAWQKKVYVKDLSYSVIIGVNEPERLEKQRVVVNLEVYERENVMPIDYPSVVRSLSKDVDRMEYLTLEKMVWEITRAACFTLGERIEKITVRAQKPSAISFARSSGVEMTRRMSDFF